MSVISCGLNVFGIAYLCTKCFRINLRFVTVIIFLKMVLQKSRERCVAKVRGFLGRGSTVSRCWKVWGDMRDRDVLTVHSEAF